MTLQHVLRIGRPWSFAFNEHALRAEREGCTLIESFVMGADGRVCVFPFDETDPERADIRWPGNAPHRIVERAVTINVSIGPWLDREVPA